MVCHVEMLPYNHAHIFQWWLELKSKVFLIHHIYNFKKTLKFLGYTK